MERPVVLSELQVEPDCRNLAEYLQKFDLPIQCLQTREGIKKASKEFLLDVEKIPPADFSFLFPSASEEAIALLKRMLVFSG